MLPEPRILFLKLEALAGTMGGARERFQMLVTDLVKLEHPDADEVAGPGGQDWGIDTFIGTFDSTVTVWQSKFFMEWSGETQRKQVRESFKQIVDKAQQHGLTLDAWILTLPIILSPEERKWFDTWAKKQSKAHGVRLRIWSGMDLRHKLMRPDAAGVCRAYFDTPTAAPEGVAEIGNLGAFDDALFVHQLYAAGQVETDAARGLFFAADALVRDIAARGDEVAAAGMSELHLEIHNLWESRFNDRVASADADGRMGGLIEHVVNAAGQLTDPDGLRLRPAHRRGVVHRLVEDARAGWVRHWRDIVELRQIDRESGSPKNASDLSAAQTADR